MPNTLGSTCGARKYHPLIANTLAAAATNVTPTQMPAWTVEKPISPRRTRN